MTCVRIGNAIVTFSPSFRLRLNDGGYVYMSFHYYSGPFFYHDKYENREIVDWFENKQLVDAYNWFAKRGNVA